MLKKLSAKLFQVINVRPTREVEIYMIMSEDRLGEEEAQSLVEKVQRFWSAPPKED